MTSGTIQYRAAVLHGVGAPMSVEPVAREGLGPSDVLVRIKATGLCHTDLGRGETIRSVVVF